MLLLRRIGNKTPRMCTGLHMSLRGMRPFHQSVNKNNSTVVNAPSTIAGPKISGSAEYLKTFSTSELVSFCLIGFATINKPVLNMCIKMFPYVPMAVIKALVYKIYCGGETFAEVQRTGDNLVKRGINNMMISLTIEACDGNDNVDPKYIVSETSKSIDDILIPHTVKVILESGKNINAIPAGYVALKPTGFTKDAATVLKNYNSTHKAQFDDLVENAAGVCSTVFHANKKLAQKYPERVAPFVVAVVDAEKHELQPGVYELQRRLYQRFNPVDAPVSVVGTLQMYLSESESLLKLEESLAEKNNYRLGLKLVRGAYIHSEANRNTIIHRNKEATDLNYNNGISYCIDSILKDSKNGSTIGHLVVASHNADSCKLATEKLVDTINPNKNNVCLGQLLGMADNITHNLIKNYRVDNIIKYVPWGPPLETKQYLLRRLEENGDAVKNDNGWPLIKATFSVLCKRLIGV